MTNQTDTSRLLLLSLLGLLLFVLAAASSEATREGRPDMCSDGQCRVPQTVDVPTANPPREIRQPNYRGGSCVHASMVTLLHWQGQQAWGDWWRRRYAHGESASGLIAKADRAGLDIAYTRDGNAAFLEWASRTRRGAVIFYFSNHSICFLGYEGGDAVLLDNNHVDRYIRVPKQTFLRKWRGYGGFALSPVYSPTPPEPRI